MKIYNRNKPITIDWETIKIPSKNADVIIETGSKNIKGIKEIIEKEWKVKN